MAKERNALKAGLFIIISVALIIGFTVGIKGLQHWIEPSEERIVQFTLRDDVGGLRRGDEVRIGGVKEGEIKEIKLTGYDTEDPADDRVRITFTLPKRLMLRENATIRVQSTLTGVAWLNVESLGAGKMLAMNQPIDGKPGAMSELFASAGNLAPELLATVKDLRSVTIPKVNTAVDHVNDAVATYKETGAAATDLVKHVRGQVDPLVGKVTTVADRTTEAMTEARDILGGGKGDIGEMLANLNVITGNVREKAPGILDQVDTALTKVNSAVDNATVTLSDLQVTAANVKEVSAAARSLVSGNRGKLEEMVSDLNVTSNNLKAASVEIRHSPWRLLYKPKKDEMANLNLYDATRQFADGANSLNDAAAALRDALKDPAVSDDQVKPLVEKLDQSFDNFKQVESELWKRVKD